MCGAVEHLRCDAGVDIAMNTHLKNVKLILKGQPAQPLDGMSVRGNQIRRAAPLPFGMPAALKSCYTQQRPHDDVRLMLLEAEQQGAPL